MAALACTPTAPAPIDRKPAPLPKPAPRKPPLLKAGEVVLAVVEWTGRSPVVGESLCVYNSGRLDYRAIEETAAEHPISPLERKIFRVARCPSILLGQLREACSRDEFHRAGSHYVGDVPHMSTALFCDMMGFKWVRATGMPTGLPESVDAALTVVKSMRLFAMQNGVDAFFLDAPSEGRLLVVHRQTLPENAGDRTLSVFADGQTERRVGSMGAGDAGRVGLSPHTQTMRLSESALVKLQELIGRFEQARDLPICDPTLGCRHELVTAHRRGLFHRPQSGPARDLLGELEWLASGAAIQTESR